MLAPVETLLARPLEAALPAGTTILVGPQPAPAASGAATLWLRALALSRPEAPAAVRPRPDGAWPSRRHRLPAPDPEPAGNARAYTLPAEAHPILEEVQAPHGVLARRGEDFALEGRTLHFLADQPGPVEVITRPPRTARGWHERGPAEVSVEIAALAPAPADADSLLGQALGATLGALADIEVVTLAWIEPAGLRLRLLDLSARIERIDRDAAEAGWARAAAQLVLAGTLETMVAIDAPRPEGGRIAGIETAVELPGGGRLAARVGGGG